MAKKDKKQLKKDERIISYRDEYKRWLDVLDKYHQGRFDENYRQYTALASTKSTSSVISDPVAPELVERVVQKLFEQHPKFSVESRGRNLPKEVKKIMAGVIHYFWTAPEMVQESGTMRSRLKKLGREFCVVGNAATEVFYNSKSEMPDIRVIPIEDVIFDPAKTLKTSSVYYVRQFVDIDYLKDNVEILDTEGKKESGIFSKSAIAQLERLEEERKGKRLRQDPTTNRIQRSGDESLPREVGEYQLISRWEGKKCCRFIYDKGLEEPEALQEFENNVLGEDPYDFVMDIEVNKEPYAFGMLDSLTGVTRAKDLFLNQLVDYGAKVLNPPLFVDPSLAPINRQTLRNAWRTGGLVFAPPQLAEHKQMPSLGNFGFDMLGYLQSRSEQVSGVGAYLAGVPNQESDKTEGTKGGIEALMQKAVSPLHERQINIEESIIEPVVNKWLKMAGALMDENDVKWVMLGGENSQWVAVTKGMLNGKIKLQDLMDAGLVGDSQIQDIVDLMLSQGKDPENDVMFDVDWVVRVETGSLADANTEKELRGLRENALLAQQLGVKLDVEELWKEIARRSGVKDPGQYVLKGQEAQAALADQMVTKEMVGVRPGSAGSPQGGGGMPTMEPPKAQVPQSQAIGQGPMMGNL